MTHPDRHDLIPDEARRAGWDALTEAATRNLDLSQGYACALAAAAPLIVAAELERLADSPPDPAPPRPKRGPMSTTTVGYWTEHRMAIWHGLTPQQRDHDRYIGIYPPGRGAMEAEIQCDGERAHECTCFINPPCSHCVDCTECQPA